MDASSSGRAKTVSVVHINSDCFNYLKWLTQAFSEVVSSIRGLVISGCGPLFSEYWKLTAYFKKDGKERPEVTEIFSNIFFCGVWSSLGFSFHFISNLQIKLVIILTLHSVDTCLFKQILHREKVPIIPYSHGYVNKLNFSSVEGDG